MRRIVLYILILLTNFSFLGLANSDDSDLDQTEINVFTGMFDFSDTKQASGLIGFQHQNDNLFRKTFLGTLSSHTFSPANILIYSLIFSMSLFVKPANLIT